MGCPLSQTQRYRNSIRFAGFAADVFLAAFFTAAQATQLNDIVVSYHDAYGLAANPQTATKGTRADKDLKRAICEATLRQFARQVQANPAVTAQQKIDLGLPLRDQEPTPRN